MLSHWLDYASIFDSIGDEHILDQANFSKNCLAHVVVAILDLNGSQLLLKNVIDTKKIHPLEQQGKKFGHNKKFLNNY